MYKSKIKSLKSDEEDLREEQQRYLTEEISWGEENFQRPICDDPDSLNNQITIHVRLYDHEANLEATKRVLSTNECKKKCIVTLPRNAVCSNMNMEIEYNIKLTFWLYLVIRVFIGTYFNYLPRLPLMIKIFNHYTIQQKIIFILNPRKEVIVLYHVFN